MTACDTLGRRSFLAGALASVAARGEAAAPAGIPIIDAHVHLFDGTRPQGAPYLGSSAYRAISKTSLPADYGRRALPAGIVGAVAVEASPWIEDNLWLLEVAAADPLIVGVVGRLDPTKPEFAEYLGRYRRNPLYRGIRFSRFYRRDGDRITLDPAAVDGLGMLADADLSLDTANPTLPLLQANLLLAEAVPTLRIVVDHLPAFDPKPEEQASYDAVIDALATHPNVFVKLSQVYHPRADDSVATDFAAIKARLDRLFGAFGEDRVLYGSDYPNSYGVATITQSIDVMKRFLAAKPKSASENYFWRNPVRVYKWLKRSPLQP